MMVRADMSFTQPGKRPQIAAIMSSVFTNTRTLLTQKETPGNFGLNGFLDT